MTASSINRRRKKRPASNSTSEHHLFEISESVALLEQATEANQRQIQQVAENTSRQIGELATNTDRQLREIAVAGEKRGAEFQNEMKALASEFSRSRQTNWPTVIAFITLTLMFVGGAYKIVDLQTQVTMSPIASKTEIGEKDRIELRQGITANSSKIAIVDTERKVITTKLAEIETQFRASDEARNVQFAEQQRMNSILMQLAQGKHPIEYPTAPYYHPHIAAPIAAPNGQNH